MSIGKAYALALLLSLSLPAVAAEPVKIGVITTLSGPGGYLGQDALDAFKLGYRRRQAGRRAGAIAQRRCCDESRQCQAHRRAVPAS